ncbi:MAG: ABC transporter substrate-binding protein [Candidatus Competibacterales bacterium]
MRPAFYPVAATAAVLCWGTAQAQQPDSLTISSWGGAYTMSQTKAYHEPFTEKTGIKINNVDKSSAALAYLRTQVESGNIESHVVDVLEVDAIIACDEGLAREIDYDNELAAAPDGTPPSEDFLEGSLSGCFIPTIVYSTVLAYSTEQFADNPPGGIADLWDLEAYPGKRALRRVPNGNLEWALYADGVPREEIYERLSTPEGVEQAFAKLDEIKEQVIWWQEGAQPPQLLADGEAVIVSAYNGRIFNAQVTEDQPFEILWDGQLYELDGWVVPTGVPAEETVMEYISFSTDTQRLADQAKYISYGPARKSSAPLVSQHEETGVEMSPHMPTAPENFETPIKVDPLFWADNQDTLTERFNAWLAR